MANIKFLFGQHCSGCNYILELLSWTEKHVKRHQKNGNSKSRLSEALKFILLIHINKSQSPKIYVPEHYNSCIR